MHTLFFFGSLRDREVLETVVGHPVDDADIRAARAPGHAIRGLPHETYPHLVEEPGAVAEGIVVSNLSEEDVSRLSYYEWEEYDLAPIMVETSQGEMEVEHFASAEDVTFSQKPWDFARWQRDDRAVAVEAAAELMALRGTIPWENVETVWSGIKIRARARARAKAEPNVAGRLRGSHDRADVVTERIDRPYTAFFAIEEHRLRHRQFDGNLSDPVERTVVTSGDAVTVIPYDAGQDRVMLIEQFRAPIHARGDQCPWAIEAIAGRIDQELDAERCARREAGEEGGIELGRIEKIAAYYATPGIAAEHVTSFAGEARLDGEGGIYGVEHENEDIRAFTCPLDEALAAVASGEINTAPAVLSLLWLQQNRDRLRRKWA